METSIEQRPASSGNGIGKLIGVVMIFMGGAILFNYAPTFFSFIDNPQKSSIIKHLKVFDGETIEINAVVDGRPFQSELKSTFITYYLAIFINIIILSFIIRIALLFISSGTKLFTHKNN